MTTPVTICNLALMNLGETPNITSISPPDGSANAAYAALAYPVALGVLLKRRGWLFGKATAALTGVTSTNPLWGFSYTLPADYLSLINVKLASDPQQQMLYYGAYGLPPVGDFSAALEYEVEAGLLYANTDSVVLTYCSATLAVEANFPDYFVEALSAAVSAKLAGPIIKGDVGGVAIC